MTSRFAVKDTWKLYGKRNGAGVFDRCWRYDAVKLKIRYSLRVLLLAMTVIAIWLGMRVNSAMKQRSAVATIQEAGGSVYFNWQLQPIYNADGDVDYFKVIRDPKAIPAPEWLRRLVGDEFFQYVVKVNIHPDNVNDQTIAAMGRLPRLDSVDLSWEQFDPDDSPKMTRKQLDDLKQLVSEQCPNASVWSLGL